MQITAAHIRRIAPKARNAEALAASITQWAPMFCITTPLRMAHFLAQCAHETMGFVLMTEMASGKQYEWNRVLGNTRRGDGVKFKGRGLLQLTGRANYQAYARSRFCNGDLMSHPDWLAQLPGAVKSAMWFWWSRGLNTLADQDNVMAITRKINGGLNGIENRKIYLTIAKATLGV